MKRKVISEIFSAFIFSFFLSAPASAGGTVVGNGGDPIFEFMEAVRISLIETLKALNADPNKQASFCQQEPLNAEQVKFCRDYFLTVLPEMLRLNQGLSKTLFVLRDQPLYVEGPDGQPMVVAARTESGPNGPIELNRDAVKTMLPTQALFLLTHEFQHKSNFKGVFVGDNEPIGPFATSRDLLDSAAKSLVALARKEGKVGSQFGIRDRFDCKFSAPTGLGAAIVAGSRLFQSEDLMFYRMSIGKNPTDLYPYLPETNTTSILMKFEITEPNNCGDPHPSRKTMAQIVRRADLPDGSTQDEVLSEREILVNPMCPNSDRKIEISWQNIQFSCAYVDSQGVTNSNYSLRNLFSKRQ